MNMRHIAAQAAALFVLGWLVSQPCAALAHCDGLDGPVVMAARKALAENDVNLVLVWVREQDEDEIRRVFDHAQEVRKLGAAAADLADRFLFETLVRIHREGEGAPYTGLEPAGRDLGPAIPLADEALETGDVDALVHLVTDAMRAGLVGRFERAAASRAHASSDVRAGREHVHDYVAFVHFAEQAYALATETGSGHAVDGGGTAEHDHR